MVLYAKDIVENDFLTPAAGTTVLEGARAMKMSKRGFAIIGDPSHPEGIVTEWDILSKAVAEGVDLGKVTLGEIMTRELVSVDADVGISTVTQVMAQKGVRRLLARQEGTVIGFITSKTILARLNDYVDKVSSQISRLQAPWF
jgi:predicted transcriptional regulator